MALDNGKILWQLGNNDVPLPERKPTLYTSAILTPASGTTPVTLFTGSPYYYITRLLVSFDPNCTISGGAVVAITFTDSSYGIVGSARVWCPNTFTSPTSAQPSTIVESGFGYFFNSTTAGSTLSIALSATLGAGAIRAAVNYGLTSLTA